MKKTAVLLILCTALCLLSSCAGGGQAPAASETGTKIYFVREDKLGRKYLDYEYRDDVQGASNYERITAILNAIREPLSSDALPAIPQTVDILNVRLRGSTLEITYTPMYHYLSTADKLLAAAAVSRTMFEDGKVQYVMLTSNGYTQPPAYDAYIYGGSIRTDSELFFD